jgi:YihY family inner membrane protein
MEPAEPGVAQRWLRRADDVQRRHAALGFPLAVVRKFGDDRAGQLAALIAYYGFFSLFPLLLVFATVVSIVVRGDQDLQQQLIGSALRQFPVVGTKIHDSIGELSGSSITLVVGIVGALWSGTAVVTAAQHAMDEVWDVPRVERPSIVRRAIRAFALLAGFVVAIVASAVLAGIGGGGGAGAIALRIVSTLASLLLSVAMFAFAFRVLTVAPVRWRDVIPGAIVAAVAWTLLLLGGGWLVDHEIRHASQAYGFFAIVIGLLTWIFVIAQVTVLAAEVNVVLARRLWPRALIDPPEPEDRRVIADQAREERARPDEEVDVTFRGSRDGADTR